MKEAVPSAPGYVRWIVRTLEDAGYETWTVGGAVRNTLLGIPSGDWDLTTRARPGTVRNLFRRTVPIGVDHGTVGVLTRQGQLVEITTFRRDVETSGRHAVVAFADSLDEDLGRRDFTINAIAWHPLREEFADPFRGRRDLAAGLLRTVGEPRERFAEDYLRVLRALRFSGRFRLRIQTGTWKALGEAAVHLDCLSPERVREELMKVLGQAARPSASLSLYDAAGVLDVLYPELAARRDAARPESGENLWVHGLLLADLLPRHRPLLRLASVLQALDGRRKGVRGREEPAAALLMRLRFSNADIAAVADLLRVGLEPPLHLDSRPDLRRWLHEAGPGRLPDLARLWMGKARLATRRGAEGEAKTLELVRRLRRELRSGNPLDQDALALNGRDLISMGLKPGPRFGEILSRLMDRVLDDPELNRPEILREMVRDDMDGGRERDGDT